MVAATGFEPVTLRVWTECSSQLSYAAISLPLCSVRREYYYTYRQGFCQQENQKFFKKFFVRQKALIFPFLQRAVMLKKGSLARQSFSHCQCACMASSASMISSQWIFPFSFKIADRRFLSCSMAQERPMHTPYDRHSLSFARVRWNQKMAAEALCLSKMNGIVV